VCLSCRKRKKRQEGKGSGTRGGGQRTQKKTRHKTTPKATNGRGSDPEAGREIGEGIRGRDTAERVQMV